MGFNRSQRRQLERQLNKKQTFETIRERVKNQAQLREMAEQAAGVIVKY